MSLAEEYANYLDSDGTMVLFDKYKKHVGNNRELASKEIGITKKSTYDWADRKEDVKHITKVKILEKLIEELPVETFQYITQSLYASGTETLMSCLSTLYEQSFDASGEEEYKKIVSEFEGVNMKYAGLVYKNRDLEVNHMFSKLVNYAKSKHYDWKPKQTILYDSNEVKTMIPQIINSWVYHGLPQSAEELSTRLKFPLDIVSTVRDTVNQQLLSTSTKENNIAEISGDVRAGVFLEGDVGTMMSTAGNIRSKQQKSLSLGAA